ncbi:TPA: Lrp/AsnC family transcriptional regulator [Candidatus Micrarchaeota archaeon]|nr:Lrp/AsnC family transcriptional regulator [Candidatus Micrarchaeota archaeon]
MEFIKRMPEVEALYEVTGESDVMVFVRTKSREELLKVIKAIRTRPMVLSMVSRHILVMHKGPFSFNPLRERENKKREKLPRPCGEVVYCLQRDHECGRGHEGDKRSEEALYPGHYAHAEICGHGRCAHNDCEYRRDGLPRAAHHHKGDGRYEEGVDFLFPDVKQSDHKTQEHKHRIDVCDDLASKAA